MNNDFFRRYISLLFILFSIASSSAVLGQRITTSDKEAISLFYRVEQDMDTYPENVKNSFQDFISYCKSKGNDTTAAAGIGIITNYYIDHSNYFEAIRWYYYGTDSLCKDRGGKCITLRRNFSKLYKEIGDNNQAINILKNNLVVFHIYDKKLGTVQEYGEIATLFLSDNQLDSSRHYFEKALQFSKDNQLFYNEVLSYNNLGYYFAQVGDFKSSEENYKAGISLLENHGKLGDAQQRQLALLKGNLGGLYLDQDLADKGIPLLEYDAKINLNSKEVDLGVNALIRLAQFYYKHQDYQSALNTLNTCLKHESSVKNVHIVLQIYNLLFKSYLELGDIRNAQKYYEIYTEKNNAVKAKEEAEKLNIEKSLLSNILNTQLEYQKREIELKERENEALSAKNKYVQLRFLVVVGFIVLFIVFGVIYFRKRVSVLKMTQQLAEQHLKIERIEKEKIDAELKYKNKDLTDFAIDIARKQEILEELKEKLYELRNQRLDNHESKMKINELIQYTNNNLVVDTQLTEFQKNIEDVNYRFFDTLKERFPDLTELDKQICGLIRLGLSNKEIAIMRNVSYKAVRMARYRLRKKMQMESEENIVEFLKSI